MKKKKKEIWRGIFLFFIFFQWISNNIFPVISGIFIIDGQFYCVLFYILLEQTEGPSFHFVIKEEKIITAGVHI